MTTTFTITQTGTRRSALAAARSIARAWAASVVPVLTRDGAVWGPSCDVHVLLVSGAVAHYLDVRPPAPGATLHLRLL
ncbi:MAG: hypothetical protein A2Y38_04580 [Spirochaetes bacterium GWB1_59_5]|nr:MAG: hypothetical protein A2Y38_04580 [Spirochaetes bacterium GWB1_59_5]